MSADSTATHDARAEMIGAREVGRLLGSSESTGLRRMRAWYASHHPADGSGPADTTAPPVTRTMTAPTQAAPPRETYLVPRGAVLRWMLVGDARET